jgi:hypothetical protein
MNERDREAVLFANSAFYTVFTARDMAGMDRAWADGPVTCIHPGWPPLEGREAVMNSWQGILRGQEVFDVTAFNAAVAIYGDVAVVTCLELLKTSTGPQVLGATNIFVRKQDSWKLVHHQAGPSNFDPRTLAAKREPSVN